MKQSTQDRLLSDAILAASSWHKEANIAENIAYKQWEMINVLRSRQPIFFLAGMLTATLGILLAAQVFNVN